MHMLSAAFGVFNIFGVTLSLKIQQTVIKFFHLIKKIFSSEKKFWVCYHDFT